MPASIRDREHFICCALCNFDVHAGHEKYSESRKGASRFRARVASTKMISTDQKIHDAKSWQIGREVNLISIFGFVFDSRLYFICSNLVRGRFYNFGFLAL